MIKTFLSKILNNLPYKIAALFLAVLTWYIVQGEEILEINRRVEIVVNTPDGVTVKEPKVQSRDITLRGPRVLLGDFSSRPLQATIKVPPGRLGALRYRIDKEFIPHWDNRLRLTVHDPYVSIFVDEKAGRPVKVKVSLTGEPKDGMMVGPLVVQPPEITVSGLKSEVQKLTEVMTETIDVKGLDQLKQVKIPISKSNLSDMEVSEETVTVSIPIVERMMSKKIDSVPVVVTNSEYVSSIRPPAITVIVQGPPSEINLIKRSDIQAFIDAKDLKPDRYDKEIQIKIPFSKSTAEADPKTTSIEIYNQRKLRH